MTIILFNSPVRAEVGCQSLLSFGEQEFTAAAAVNLSPAELKVRIPNAAEIAFDKLAEQGVDFTQLEKILSKDWLVKGDVFTEEKIHRAFSGTTQYGSMLYWFLVEVEKKLSLQPELAGEVREAVLAGLRERVTQVETAREAMQPVIQRVGDIDPRFEPTSTGAVFKPVDDPEMGKSVRDESGRVWSEVHPDLYTNVGTAKAGETITDSDAAEACKKIGGRLPSKEDFEGLMAYFYLTSNGRLTHQGLADFRRIFPDMSEKRFWSSSVLPGYSVYAYDLYGHSVTIEYALRVNASAVVCVRSP